MSALKSITIIGGGLAGLTLGIGLRQRGVPVTIWEAGHYPRHRVCGEFISGNGQAVLEQLGLRAKFNQAGAIQVRTVQFIAGKNCSPIRELPPAIGFSRYEMDRLLADEFKRLGGELRELERWNSEYHEGIVRASGRRARPTENGWRWFGLKIHARNVNLHADLEMHICHDSYVGVNRINDGEINVCGLFRSRPGQATEKPGIDLLRGEPGSALHECLKNSVFDKESFCSVAGLSLKPHRAATNGEICIGDALTMIPPATGNGMSMAFESAQLAIEPLATYSRSKITWQQAHQTIACACDAAFTQRLRWAGWLQRLMFSPMAQNRIGLLLMRSETFWDFMFTKTR